MRPRDFREARPSYFDRLTVRHPEMGTEVPSAAPTRAPGSRLRPPRSHRPLASALTTAFALAGIAGATVVAIRLGGPMAALTAAVEPQPPAAPASARTAVDDQGMVPVRIEVVDPAKLSSDEDVETPVSLEREAVVAPAAGRSATATAVAGSRRGFERAVKVFAPSPVYPETAAREGRGGRVVLAVRVDESGAVAAVDLDHGVDPELDAAAVEAVGRWLFTPARLDGRPVPDTVRTAVRFVPPIAAPAATVSEASPPIAAPAAREAEPAPRGETRPATRLVSPLPKYPASAWAAGRSGAVTLDVVIAADGRVDDVRLVRGLGTTIDAAAIEAVRRWRFAPALDDGVAVPSVERFSLRFAPQVAALEPPRP